MTAKMHYMIWGILLFMIGLNCGATGKENSTIGKNGKDEMIGKDGINGTRWVNRSNGGDRGNGSGSPGEAAWRFSGWAERYQIVFDSQEDDVYSQTAMATFHPLWSQSTTPYDVVAVDDLGSTCSVLALDWKPQGEATFLIDVDRIRRRQDAVSVYLYMGNRTAPPTFSPVPWMTSQILIGSNLKRSYRCHGQWNWEPDPRFEAVHTSIGLENPLSRTNHSVTGIPAISCHPRRMRITQMVQLDPEAMPQTIGLEFFFEGKMVTACWSSTPELPPSTEVTEAHYLGPLPSGGRWTCLEVVGTQLQLHDRKILQGIGFSVRGGRARWGPTVVGAMPRIGRMVSREIRRVGADGNARIEKIAPPSPSQITNPPSHLRLDLVRIPLFISERESLNLTLLISPDYRFVGEMENCMVETTICFPAGGSTNGRFSDALLRGDGERVLEQRFIASFPGGGSWQRMIAFEPDQWVGANAIISRVIVDGQSVSTATLLLKPIEGLPGLSSNGGMLCWKGAGVAFVLPDRTDTTNQTDSTNSTNPTDPTDPTDSINSTNPIDWTDRTNPTDRMGQSAERRRELIFTSSPSVVSGAGCVSINSDDRRLGLPDPVSPLNRRSSSEWVAAASRAVFSGEFDIARIEIRRDLLEIGLSSGEVRGFLEGMVRLLKSNPNLRIELDTSNLPRPLENELDRLLWASALEIRSLVASSISNSGKAGIIETPSGRP